MKDFDYYKQMAQRKSTNTVLCLACISECETPEELSVVLSHCSTQIHSMSRMLACYSGKVKHLKCRG